MRNSSSYLDMQPGPNRSKYLKSLRPFVNYRLPTKFPMAETSEEVASMESNLFWMSVTSRSHELITLASANLERVFSTVLLSRAVFPVLWTDRISRGPGSGNAVWKGASD